MPRVKKETVTDALLVPMYTLRGTESGTLLLPKEVFGAKINQTLLAQATRVYLSNLKGHFAHTKTRGEVRGSTRKIRVQKGTGGARHGSVRAPIFVGGGIALGPKSRKVMLDLPKKMKAGAFVSALSLKLKEHEILGVSGADKASGKTKEVLSLFRKVAKNNILLVLDKKEDKIRRAVNNLPGVRVAVAEQLNVLEVLRAGALIITEGAVESLALRIKNSKLKELGKEGQKE